MTGVTVDAVSTLTKTVTARTYAVVVRVTFMIVVYVLLHSTSTRVTVEEEFSRVDATYVVTVVVVEPLAATNEPAGAQSRIASRTTATTTVAKQRP
jgi:hypothetical protein